MYKLAVTFAFAFSIFILWSIYLANTGGSSIFFHLVEAIPYGDKVGHFLLFGTLTFMFIIASQFKRFSIGQLSVYYGTSLVSLFVVVEELSQIYIPNRTFDLLDLTADFAGISTFTGLSYIFDRLIQNKRTNQND